MRHEAKCLQTHATLTHLQTRHMWPLCPSWGQFKSHVTTPHPIRRLMWTWFPLATSLYWICMVISYESNQIKPATICYQQSGGGAVMWLKSENMHSRTIDSPSWNTPNRQFCLYLMQSWHDYISHHKSMHVLEVIQQRGWINKKFIPIHQCSFFFSNSLIGFLF